MFFDLHTQSQFCSTLPYSIPCKSCTSHTGASSNCTYLYQCANCQMHSTQVSLSRHLTQLCCTLTTKFTAFSQPYKSIQMFLFHYHAKPNTISLDILTVFWNFQLQNWVTISPQSNTSILCLRQLLSAEGKPVSPVYKHLSVTWLQTYTTIWFHWPLHHHNVHILACLSVHYVPLFQSTSIDQRYTIPQHCNLWHISHLLRENIQHFLHLSQITYTKSHHVTPISKGILGDFSLICELNCYQPISSPTCL